MITIEFLTDWALRSAGLIVSGALLLKLLRVKDPSVRLAAWTAILCCSSALPLLTASLPAMPVHAPQVAAPRAAVQPAVATVVFRPADPVAPEPRHFDWRPAAIDVYLIFAAALLFRIVLGIAMTVRLLRGSRAIEIAGVRETDRIASPVTLGVIRPSILLPLDWRQWDATKLEAVLAHERAHIRRRDPLVQSLSALHRAVLWFSPLSWYLDRQIVRLAEEASDDAAVIAIRDRVTYAETLLEFVQRSAGAARQPGVPMARYGAPDRRIHRILDATTLSRGVTRWSILAIVALGLPVAYVVAAAQERLTFEAASVKPYQPSPGRRDDKPTGGPGTANPVRIHYPMATAQFLVTQAYGVSDYQISGPDWLDRQFFEVNATMAPGTTREQFRTMLRNLLVDRFKLASHRETREFSGYALTVARSGPKLKESQATSALSSEGAADPPLKPGADGFFVPPRRPGMFLQLVGTPPLAGVRSTFYEFTMQSLAVVLRDQLKRPVIDETGLVSKYDFVLNFSAQGVNLGHGRIPVSGSNPDGDMLPDLASALLSQLGLKLEPKKVSQDVVVIEHMEKVPTEN